MTKYIDTDGREWPSPEEALQEFLDDLPSLTEEQMEALTQHTRHNARAAHNLKAIAHAIDQDSELAKLFKDYPVPTPELLHAKNKDVNNHMCLCGMIYPNASSLQDHIIRENTLDLDNE